MALPAVGGKAARQLLTKLAADYLASQPRATRADVGQYLPNRITQEDKTTEARLAGEQLMAILPQQRDWRNR
jgi:hypothetical protein